LPGSPLGLGGGPRAGVRRSRLILSSGQFNTPKRGRGRPPKPGGPLSGTERNIRWAQKRAGGGPIENLPRYLGGRYRDEASDMGDAEDPDARREVASFIADVIYALYDSLGIDLDDEDANDDPIIRLLGGPDYVRQVQRWRAHQNSRKKVKMPAPGLP
jgi:hypothetical protein